MAIARKTTGVRPLEGSTVRRRVAGAAIEVGEVVAMQADGKVDPADTTAAKANGLGIALQAAGDGDPVDVVVYGPVLAVTGATPAAIIHASDTAGEPAESAGTNAGVLGYAESATVIFVSPVVA